MTNLPPAYNTPSVSRYPKLAVIIIGVTIVLCVILGTCGVGLGLSWLLAARSRLVDYQPQEPVEQGIGGTRTGEQALDFEVTGLDGKAVKLSDYQGKAVLLNFWATWCGYCIDEFPAIQEYQDLYSENLVVLAVEQGSPADEVAEFVSLNYFSFIFLPDENYRVGDEYGVMAIPASYFIDQDGIIRMIHEGLMEKVNIEAGIRAVGLR
jgi:peroxiredoxin